MYCRRWRRRSSEFGGAGKIEVFVLPLASLRLDRSFCAKPKMELVIASQIHLIS